MSEPLILPDSRLKTVLTPKNSIWFEGAWWVPLYCASCSVAGPHAPEENMTHCTWVCDPCGDKLGNIDGVYTEPDTVFFERVREAQIERYGRTLTVEETITSLSDPNSLESRLAVDRKNLTPKAGG